MPVREDPELCGECKTIPWLHGRTVTRRDALKFAAALAGTVAGAGAMGAGTASAAPRLLDPAAPAVQAITNAVVLTQDSQRPTAEAVLVEGDRITLVGGTDEVRAALRNRGGGPDTDLGGQTLTPGFIDPHGHFLLLGVSSMTADLSAPPLGPVESMDQVLTLLREQAGRSDGWVVGMKFDDTAIREQRFPTLAELDAVAPGRPVFVLHISSHLAMVNSAGLAKLGITHSADPAAGSYGRFADGAPDGRLYESAASTVLTKVIPISPDGIARVLESATDRCLSAGVTTGMDSSVSPQLLTAYNLIGTLPYLRVRLGLWIDGDQPGQVRGVANTAPNQSPWLRTLAVKGFADGSIQGWTAALTQPYHSLPASGAPDGPAGKLRTSVADLTELIVAAFDSGLRAAIHANGDAAADAVMAATRAARERTGSDLPVLMQHCQVLRDDQIRQLAGLGIQASVFSRHVYVWGDRHRDLFLGPGRAARLDPARSLIDAGVPVTLHNDTPITPLDPLAVMRDAVQRRTASGAILGAAERIRPHEALAAYTGVAAQQLGLTDRGVLAPGRLADFTVLQGNPLDTDFDGVGVTQTWVGGVRRWAR